MRVCHMYPPVKVAHSVKGRMLHRMLPDMIVIHVAVKSRGKLCNYLVLEVQLHQQEDAGRKGRVSWKGEEIVFAWGARGSERGGRVSLDWSGEAGGAPCVCVKNGPMMAFRNGERVEKGEASAKSLPHWQALLLPLG